jgi:hypothetical protein
VNGAHPLAARLEWQLMNTRQSASEGVLNDPAFHGCHPQCRLGLSPLTSGLFPWGR